MATQTQDQPGTGHPSDTPDRNVESGVEGTFPASDPVAFTASQGSRAVPAEEMMQGSGPAPAPDDAVTLSLRFPDSETAKLALESAVRDGPMDRRSARIEMDDSQVTMRVDVPRADRDRIDGLLRRHGAMEV